MRNTRTIKVNVIFLPIGLELNADKTKYMVMSRDQNAGQSYNKETDNKSFERLGQFNFFGTTLMNPNSIQEEVISRLKLGNACYPLVQNLLSCSLLSKNVKIKIYRTIIFPVVLCGCETWSIALRKESRLTVSDNRVLRKIFGATKDGVTEEWRRLHNE